MTKPHCDAPAGSSEDRTEPETVYTVELMVQLTGVSDDMLRCYQLEGLISPTNGPTADRPSFDDETLRTLRRIEHLKTAYGMSLPGIRLLLHLQAETERLQAELRAQR
ncbi:MAG: MerR family transcriptional regulator [Verrucomicrobiales bacterium]|nr:MerR family transcriptional regulator [Verrucomicrobiales bacterium]